MRMTDGKRTIEIQMTANGDPDWSKDFFNAGSLDYDESTDTYKVEDVEWCIEQAHDWQKSIGDFADDTPNETNTVIVQWL